MGTACELLLAHDDEAVARTAAQAAIAEVARLDRAWSHYRDDSWLGRLHARAGTGESLRLDAEGVALFEFADVLHHDSEGVFDASIGALTALWDPRHGRVPSEAEVERARACVGWRFVAREGDEVCLTRAGMRLDFGGIVKEYAADRAAVVCRAHGVSHGLVDLGGDVAVIGPHRDGSPWRVGIRDPRDAERALAQVDLVAGALATSGDYARCMEVDGQRYSHLVDASEGRPRASWTSISVRADSCLMAGAAATVSMLLPPARREAWLARMGAPWFAIDHDGAHRGPLARDASFTLLAR